MLLNLTDWAFKTRLSHFVALEQNQLIATNGLIHPKEFYSTEASLVFLIPTATSTVRKPIIQNSKWTGGGHEDSLLRFPTNPYTFPPHHSIWKPSRCQPWPTKLPVGSRRITASAAKRLRASFCSNTFLLVINIKWS